ncbi:hypothetical protein AB0D14_24970 [Streptomyces sp. NPDC048484]|uniref:hypothetical protein n=1 Tax=Streptomyces sp. NPDC048484 TaxID=3155146 RepID=UPI00341E6865
MLDPTAAGREDIPRRLRETAEHEITDFSRRFTILAFLSPTSPRPTTASTPAVAGAS